MEENKLIPFPQADDFNKVILLINFPKEKLKDNEYIKTNLHDITERQVSYYISAAQYLNVIDSKRNMTDVGLKLQTLNSAEQTIELIRIMIADEIIGTAFLTELIYDFQLEKEELISMIRKKYPTYSDKIYGRRAQTLKSWLKWMKNNINN